MPFTSTAQIHGHSLENIGLLKAAQSSNNNNQQ
jgi:hypothetical protein